MHQIVILSDIVFVLGLVFVFGRNVFANFNSLLLVFFLITIFPGTFVHLSTGEYPTTDTLVFSVFYLPIMLLLVSGMAGRGKAGFGQGSVEALEARHKLGIHAFLVVAYLLLAYYVATNPPVIYDILFRHDYQRIMENRLHASLWIENGLLFRLWVMSVRMGIPLCALILYADARASGHNWLRKPSVAVPILAACFVNLMDGQKLPLFLFIMQLVVVGLIFSNRKTAGLPTSKVLLSQVRWIAPAVVLSFVMMTGIYYLYFKNRSYADVGYTEALGDVVPAIIRRSYLTQSKPLALIFSTFPDQLPHLAGRTFPNLNFLPFEQFDLSLYAYQQLTGLDYGGASTNFMGELYANFGFLLGILLGAPVILLILCGLHQFFARRCSHSIGVGYYAFLAGNIPLLAITQVFMGTALPLSSILLLAVFLRLFRFAIASGDRPVAIRQA